MGLLEWIFWTCFAIVAYTYILYPALLALLNVLIRNSPPAPRRRRSTQVGQLRCRCTTSEQNLERRLDELTRMIAASGVSVKSPLSFPMIHRSLRRSRRSFDRRSRHREFSPRARRQPSAPGAALSQTSGDSPTHAVSWADDALIRMIENFADPEDRALSAATLVLESARASSPGVGLYWRFGKWMRRKKAGLVRRSASPPSGCAANAVSPHSAGHLPRRRLLAHARLTSSLSRHT